MGISRRFPGSFYLAVAANLFFFTSFQWTFVTLPGYVQQLGGGAAQIGLAFGLFTLGAVVVRPAMGHLVDRFGRKAALFPGVAIFALSPALYALAPSLQPFMAVRVLHGMGMAAFTTAYTALVADLVPAPRRGEAVGLAGITNNVGMLFAPALGSYIQARWGYAAHFWAAAAIAAVSLICLAPVAEPLRPETSHHSHPTLAAVARTRAVWTATLGSTGLAVAYGAILSFLSPLAIERGLAAAGGTFTSFAVAMIAAQTAAGWLSDRIGRPAVAAPGLALAALAMVGMALARTEVGLLSAGAGLGLSWGLVRASLDTAVVDAVALNARGTALGFLYTCFDIGVGAGSFGLGIIAQTWGTASVFYAAAAWGIVALCGYLGWGRQSPAARPPN